MIFVQHPKIYRPAPYSTDAFFTLRLRALLLQTLFFGSFTYGDDDKNFSITPGLGYLRNESDFEFSENLTLVLSSKRRVSNSLSLISENWIFLNPENSVIMSNSGFRFFGKQLSVDFSWPFSLVQEVQELVSLCLHLVINFKHS